MQMHLRLLLAVCAALLLPGADAGAAAASGCKMVKAEEWPVRIARNKLIVEGAINGQSVGVMLDTGAGRTLIFRSAATRLGLGTRWARGFPMIGVGGPTDVEIAFVDEFRLGKIVRKGSRMLVAGQNDPGEGIAVLLGEDLLRHFDVEFDLAHNVVRLFQPADCDGVALAYWAPEGASEIPIEPIYEAGPEVIVTIHIDGQPVRALLDSGAGASMLDKSTAARLGATPTAPGVVPAGSGGGLGQTPVEFWIAPFRNVVIGDESIKDTRILFGDLWRRSTYTLTGSLIPRRVEDEPSMFLGADFLRAHRVLVSHSQRKVYFTYVGGPVFMPAKPPADAKDGSDPTTAR